MRNWTMLFVVLVFWVATPSAQAYRLVYIDKVGDVRNFTITADLKGTFSAMGVSLPMTGNAQMKSTERVVAVRNGQADLTNDFRDGNMTLLIGTAGAGGNQPRPVQQALPNFGVAYTRTPLGVRSNFRFTGNTSRIMSSEMLALTILQNVNNVIFPDREVQSGDTWSGDQDVLLPNGARIPMKVQYKLGDMRTINGKTYLVIDGMFTADAQNIPIATQTGAAGGTATQPSTMTLSMKGTTTTLFNTTDGTYADVMITLDSKVTMAGQGENAQPTTIDINVDGHITRMK